MIIEFSAANFRSIDEEQSLSFLASPDDAHEHTHCVHTKTSLVPRLLRSAVLVGPNGSGKSNLLAAIRTLRELVVDNNASSGDGLALRYTPFYSRLEEAAPSVFKIDLLLERIRYRYHVAYNSERIVFEELRVNINSKSQRWFVRKFDAGSGTEVWGAFSPGLHGPKEAWRRATGSRSLFMSTAAQLNAGQLAPLLRWFECQLNVTLNADDIDYAAFESHLKNPRFKDRAVALLRAADFAVADIRVKERNGSPRRTGAGIQLLCERPSLPPLWLAVEEYSSGAHRLINLSVPLLDGVENDRFIVIDEFDSHLHPLIAKLLLRLINDPFVAGSRIQALLVSQTLALMDLDVMRRDELWLMQMDKSNSSRLYSLKTFGPRRHERVARSYMAGHFGALPNVSMPTQQG